MIVNALTPYDVAAGLKGMIQQVGGRGMEHLGDRRKAVDLYQGVGLREDVERYFSPKLLQQISVDTLPVAQKVIDARFSVYRAAPSREYSIEIDPATWGNRDRIMPDFERMTGLLGTEGLLVTADEDERAYSFVIITEFEPIFVGADPEPVGFCYPIYSGRKVDAKDQEWECWTDAARFTINGDGGVLPSETDNVNPYGVVPIVTAHRGVQLGTTWWRPRAQDVLDAQLTYNVLGTQLNGGLMFQALGQMYGTGITDQDKIAIGANECIRLSDPQARLDMIAPPGNLQQIIEAQKWKMEALFTRYGIKAKWGADGGATSGEHQRIMEIELSNAIEADFARWLHFERELHKVCIAVGKAHGLPNIGELRSVNFVEPNVPLSDQEKRDRFDYELTHGLATRRDYFRLFNPDMADEQIDKILADVDAEKAAGQPAAAPSLADLLNAPVA